MRILFDTDVILDLLLDREPFNATAAWLVNRVHTGELEGFISAITLTTIFYLARKAVGNKRARSYIEDLLKIFQVALVNKAVLETALALPIKDYEDAVQHASAELAGAEGIVTRNVPDFKQATLKVYTPVELRAVLETLADDQ